jgi:sodium transport system ATP-binding protein
MDHAVIARRVTKRLPGCVAVDDLSLEIPFGTVLGLLGPNGAGKTTLLRMLAGHLVPTEGEIAVCGKKLPHEVARVKNSIGFLTAGMALYDRLTVRENLEHFGRLRGMDAEACAARGISLRDDLAMSEFYDRRFSTLSSGQKQKALIAGTVLHDPAVLVLDEITAALDVISSTFIVDFVRRERDRGKCVIFSTHIISEAEYVSDRIAMIHKGKLIGSGTAPELIAAHAAPNLTAAFLDAVRERIPWRTGT